MSIIKCRTKGNTSPTGKPKIYFCCHPDDFELYFDKLCNDIFQIRDCAIFYTEDMSLPVNKEEAEIIIGGNNLFIIPVTYKLLTSSNRAYDFDLAYAHEAGITILPFMMESGLDDLYSKSDKFGNIQYLNPYSFDPTEIGYKEKLSKFLKATLLSDKTVKRIQSAFDFYVFLSYRKKDRQYANKLMQLIHKNPEYNKVAIWYDEFLTPSESFTENIEKMMNNSKLFVLLVTPNLLEQSSGKPNFVMGEEYPAAKNKGMPIFPVEMKKTNKFRLRRKFDGIPECVNPQNEQKFREQLLKSLSKIAVAPTDNSPEHNYLIGLAYRDGIDVEVNRKLGLELITRAAEEKLEEAIRELVRMYYYGIDVSKNFDQAAYWQEKLIDYLENEDKDNPSVQKKFDIVDAIRFYCEIKTNRLSDIDDVETIIKHLNKAIYLCDSIQITDNYSASRFIESRLKTLRSLAIAYEYSNDFDTALSTYNKALFEWYEIEKYDQGVVDNNTCLSNRWRIAQIYHDIGILQNKKGDYFQAVESLKKSLIIYQQITKETVDYIPNMVKVLNSIADNATHFDAETADKHSLMAIDLSKQLYKENPSVYDVIYAETLMNRMYTLKEIANTSDADLEGLCLKVLDILTNHKNDNSHDIVFNIMNVTYTLAGIYRRADDFKKTEQCYKESASLAEILAKNSTIKDDISIAHILFDYATYCMMPTAPNVEQAKLLLEKSIKLFEKISVIRPDHKKYVDEAKGVLEEIKKIDVNSYNSLKNEIQMSDSQKMLIFNKFMHLYTEGDKAEQNKNYKKAYLNYQEALIQLDKLKEMGAFPGYSSYADIYDRLALCCEYMENLDEAKNFYCQAAFCALNEVEENETEEACATLIGYIKKLVSFCSDYGMEEAAEEWLNILNSLLGVSEVALQQEDTNEKNSATESENDFLTPEQKEYFEKELDRLDFIPSYTKDDEATLQAVFEIFKEKFKDMFNFYD